MRQQRLTLTGYLKQFVCCVAAALAAASCLGEEPPASNETAIQGRFIDEHVHFDDRHAGDPDKVADWMKLNNVRRCINHPLAQVRAKTDDERKQTGGPKKPAPEFALIDELNLPADVADKICRGNAERLFWSAKPDNSAPVRNTP